MDKEPKDEGQIMRDRVKADAQLMKELEQKYARISELSQKRSGKILGNRDT